MELIQLVTLSAIITSIIAVIAIATHPNKWRDLSLVMSVIVIMVQVGILYVSSNPAMLREI